MDRSPGPVDAPLPVAKCWHGFLRRRDRAEKIKEGAEALGQVIAANTYALGEVFFELSASPGSRDGNGRRDSRHLRRWPAGAAWRRAGEP
jgi:hypothetical protein